MKFLPSLKQLEYLTSLARTEHFTQASELCNVTPSTLSAGIRDLEETLGVSVAERTKRSVIITPIGKEIAARAELLLRDADDLMKLAIAQQQPMTGIIRLGIIPTIGPFLLPAILPEIEANYPNLKLYLREGQTADILKRLNQGELDLVIMALPYKTDDLEVRELFNDDFLFACNVDHDLAEKKTITNADIENQKLLLLEDGHCLRDHALNACRLPSTHTRIQFEATSLHTLIQMVAEGIGVTFIPKMSADYLLSSAQKVKFIPLQEKASREIGLVWRGSSPRHKEFEALVGIIQNHTT